MEVASHVEAARLRARWWRKRAMSAERAPGAAEQQIDDLERVIHEMVKQYRLKDEEIKRLTTEVERLKKENERLRDK